MKKCEVYGKGAAKFDVVSKTAEILYLHVSTRAPGVSVGEAIKKKWKGNSGRRALVSKELISANLKMVPLHMRQTIQSAAHAIDLSKSFFYRGMQRGTVVRKRLYAKPLLTQVNGLERVRWSLSHVLGFFNDDLMQVLDGTFNDVSPTKLSDNFLTLQSVMREILRAEVGNNFKI